MTVSRSDGDAGLDHLLPGAVAEAKLLFGRIGIADPAQRVDDDRPVEPAAGRFAAAPAPVRGHESRRARRQHESVDQPA